MPPSVSGEMTQDLITNVYGFPDVYQEHLLVYVLTLRGFFSFCFQNIT